MLALVVSGGHTALVMITVEGDAKIIGSTLDDAAGEALDKAAKLMGLGYPGGPVIEKISALGNPAKFAFPRSLTGSTGKAKNPEDRFNFSFSGVKTALFYHIRNNPGKIDSYKDFLHDTVASYQEAVLDVLCRKAADAASFHNASSVVLCGGVACNSVLRKKMGETLPKSAKLFCAEPKFCTDNAAMVAGLGWHIFKSGVFEETDADVFSRLPPFKSVPFVKCLPR